VIPTRVQGEGAEKEICAALALACRLDGLDLAIIGRGGGSREDLWTFNHERVARAVAALPVPVVSAVGHETDVTLCDLVADLGAAGGRLDALSPLKSLGRGYALARDAEGRVLKRVAQLTPGLAFRLRVTDGEVAARVGKP